MTVFEQSHPWLTFSINLSTAPAKLWVMLGECKSICESLSGIPLHPSFQHEILRKSFVEGITAAASQDGNTLSETEVGQILFHGMNMPPSHKYLSQEIINIMRGYEYIWENAGTESKSFLNPETVCEFNRIILDRLVVDSSSEPGKIRTTAINIPTHRFAPAPAEDCAYLLEQLCTWLTSKTFEAPHGLSVVYGILKAIIAHLYMTWIIPFGRGNARTAHLIEFLILTESGLPSVASNHFSRLYSSTKYDYFRHIESASSAKGKILPFIMYSVQGFLDGLRAQLSDIREHHESLAWENHINELFKNKSSLADIRRMELVIDLSKMDKPVSMNAIPEISIRIAKYYSSKTMKTLSRDLADMIKLGLIVKTDGGYMALKDTVRAFMPKDRRE
jgi:Fic family protein